MYSSCQLRVIISILDFAGNTHPQRWKAWNVAKFQLWGSVEILLHFEEIVPPSLANSILIECSLLGMS